MKKIYNHNNIEVDTTDKDNLYAIPLSLVLFDYDTWKEHYNNYPKIKGNTMFLVDIETVLENNWIGTKQGLYLSTVYSLTFGKLLNSHLMTIRHIEEK